MKKFVGVNLSFIVILSFTIHAMTVFGLDGADVNGQYGKMVTGIRVPETICSIAKRRITKRKERNLRETKEAHKTGGEYSLMR